MPADKAPEDLQMLTTVSHVVMFMLALSVLIVFVRLVRGPSLPDRVIATDLLGTLVVGMLVVGAAASGQRAFMDAAVIIALVAFVSNIAYARFIERRGQ
jgi:multicomponent Na+:H+ antiporter subunit F